jgi:pimeloyl-ACP methyl ester carboxylesterase
MLPLQALSDRYHVVIWSPRGAGLSERVTATELPPEAFVEEISAVRDALAPRRQVTLIGHSHGAGLFLRFAANGAEHQRWGPRPGCDRQSLLAPAARRSPRLRTWPGAGVSRGLGSDVAVRGRTLPDTNAEANMKTDCPPSPR